MFEHDGKQYARVSDIIRPFASFGHIDPKVLANKARIGSAVHQDIADDLNDEFCVTTRETTGYFNSYRKWKEEIKPKFLEWETRYFCQDLMLTGQIDAVVRMPDESIPVLVDWKTSAQESPTTWPMQAHLYRYLLLKNKVDVGERFLFIRLHKEGFFPCVHVYKFESNLHKKCMSAIEEFWKTDKK
jgi:hypothetical protein